MALKNGIAAFWGTVVWVITFLRVRKNRLKRWYRDRNGLNSGMLRKPPEMAFGRWFESEVLRLDDFELFCAVHEIGERVRQILAKHGCHVPGRNDLCPTDRQTLSGLFIEHSYGSLNRLWTPWGQWRFAGMTADDCSEAWKEIAELLGATLHIPRTTTEWGVIGPVYAITRFGEKELPVAMSTPWSNFVASDDVCAVWSKFTVLRQQQ